MSPVWVLELSAAYDSGATVVIITIATIVGIVITVVLPPIDPRGPEMVIRIPSAPETDINRPPNMIPAIPPIIIPVWKSPVRESETREGSAVLFFGGFRLFRLFRHLWGSYWSSLRNHFCFRSLDFPFSLIRREHLVRRPDLDSVLHIEFQFPLLKGNNRFFSQTGEKHTGILRYSDNVSVNVDFRLPVLGVKLIALFQDKILFCSLVSFEKNLAFHGKNPRRIGFLVSDDQGLVLYDLLSHAQGKEKK